MFDQRDLMLALQLNVYGSRASAASESENESDDTAITDDALAETDAWLP